MSWFLRERRRLLPLMIVIYAAMWFATGHSLDSARHLLDSSVAVGPLGFVILGTGLMCLFVPKTFVSLAAGGLFGFGEGACVLIVTAVVSAMVNYHIGRWSLPSRQGLPAIGQQLPVSRQAVPVSRQELAESQPANETQERSQQRLLARIAVTARHAGVGFHLAARLTPLPTTIISYTMGAASARQLPYATAAFLGAIPQCLWVYCGATAASDEELGPVRMIGIGCSVAAAIVLSVWLPRKMLRVVTA